MLINACAKAVLDLLPFILPDFAGQSFEELNEKHVDMDNLFHKQWLAPP